MSDLFLLAVGVYLGMALPSLITKAMAYFQNRPIMKMITPTKIDQSRLCKGEHTWFSRKTGQEGKDNKICRVCGLICGTDKMATTEALDQIEENIRFDTLEEQVYQDFVSRENDDLRKYFAEELKAGLDFGKLAKLHNAGITFGIRYNKYKSVHLPPLLKNLEKSNA